jgi:tetratricopeptide (TPR) repeat protein
VIHRHAPAVVCLFALAFAARWWLRQGLVLGDDVEEFATVASILSHGASFTDQMHVRFGAWIVNVATFWLFGISETTFLLPTMVLSSLLGVLAYTALIRWGHGRARAFVGGLLVALPPFEVVLGTLRANDSYLEVALALGFVGLVCLEERPILQGVVVAVCLWLGFYVKLWAIYVLPPLGVYALAGRRWRASGAFVLTSVLLHGVTCAYWWAMVGTPFPFLFTHAATYPVAAADLPRLFATYPALIFVGSPEFSTPLWGVAPYVLVAVVVAKLAMPRLTPGATLRMDRGDWLLLGFWASFALLLELVPNGLELDAYYSAPRIFRYLAPLSFPIALAAAKGVLDVTGSLSWRAFGAVAGSLLAIYGVQAVRANAPSRSYRASLLAIVRDVQRIDPPILVSEYMLGEHLRDVYLDPNVQRTTVLPVDKVYRAPDHERWLQEHESELDDGALLVTGLASYVHYGAHLDGFRLAWFEKPLSPSWQLVREYGMLEYLPRPEPARLWRFVRPAPLVVHDQREDVAALGDLLRDRDGLFREGMRHYDALEYAAARPYFRALLEGPDVKGEDAAFFYAATFFREERWARARHEFKRLLRRDRHGRLAGQAYWHIATCELRLGRAPRARGFFERVVREFQSDVVAARDAAGDLALLDRRREGVVQAWWRSRTAACR